MKDRETERLRQHGRVIGEELGRILMYHPKLESEGNPMLNTRVRELRGQIADEMQEAARRLGLDTVDGSNPPVVEKPEIARLIRELLLGHMEDGEPTLSIIPIGSQRIGEPKPKDDPLYKHVFSRLTQEGTIYTIGTLIALGRLVRPGFLDTLGDVRRVTLPEWSLLVGFGDSRTRFIHEAVRKIEIPAH